MCIKISLEIKTYKYSNLGQDSSIFELIMLFELNIHDTDGNQAKASLTWDYIVDRVFLRKYGDNISVKHYPPPPTKSKETEQIFKLKKNQTYT